MAKRVRNVHFFEVLQGFLQLKYTYCKICFERINGGDLFHLLHGNTSVCSECESKLKPKFIHFTVNGYKALSLYQYDESLQGLIYQFKGCHDIELETIFLERYLKELHFYFKNFVAIPAPSFEEDNIRRGFNHVKQIFSHLDIEIADILVKTEKFKQAEHSGIERTEISKYIKLKTDPNLKGKRVLLVDDVYTTGSTIKTMIDLIKPFQPKEIRVLVICKTYLKPKEQE